MMPEDDPHANKPNEPNEQNPPSAVNTPAPGRIRHFFWMGFLGATFYMALLTFLPLVVVLGVCVYMGIGSAVIKKSLKARHSSPELIAPGFAACLKLFALHIVWPVTARLL